MHIVEGVDMSNLLKVREVFERFRSNLETDQLQAGAVQAFAFSFELSWKIMKRILGKRGVATQSPRDTFREAARNGLISDPEEWFVFLDKRNLTSYTYKEENTQSIINILEPFSKVLGEFLLHLGLSV